MHKKLTEAERRAYLELARAARKVQRIEQRKRAKKSTSGKAAGSEVQHG